MTDHSALHIPRILTPLRLGLLTLAVGVWGCATQSPTMSGLPSRYSVSSDQLVVLTDIEMTKSDPLILELKELRNQVAETLDVPLEERRVVVYLFSNESEYSNYMSEAYPDLPPRRAFFIGSPAELAVYAFNGDQVRVDLRHEYTHGLLHAGLKAVPLWLDEGIAEYFEVTGRDPQRVNVEHAQRLSTAVQNGWRPDLRRLESLEDVAEMHRLDYQESWAWVHFLLHESPDTQMLLINYLNDLRENPDPGSLADRIESEMPHASERLLSYVSGFFMPHATTASF
ncbi:MAG: DUF1570 domain-containing protein [Planctomycetaceae bacterium]|nr:DUF1570 domain-containing protein [Planctomycetaceae bacterium]